MYVHTGGEKVPNSKLSSEAVEVDEISGRRLLLEFKAFGYFKRTCQLELRKNGDSIFSKGMVAKENGAWRVEVNRSAQVSFHWCIIVYFLEQPTTEPKPEFIIISLNSYLSGATPGARPRNPEA